MFYTYVLQSKTTGKIYIGYTGNLKRRLQSHNQELPTKKGSYTKINKGPWEIVYKEEFQTKKEAIRREKQLKTAKGRKFIKSRLQLNG